MKIWPLKCSVFCIILWIFLKWNWSLFLIFFHGSPYSANIMWQDLIRHSIDSPLDYWEPVVGIAVIYCNKLVHIISYGLPGSHDGWPCSLNVTIVLYFAWWPAVYYVGFEVLFVCVILSCIFTHAGIIVVISAFLIVSFMLTVSSFLLKLNIYWAVCNDNEVDTAKIP